MDEPTKRVLLAHMSELEAIVAILANADTPYRRA